MSVEMLREAIEKLDEPCGVTRAEVIAGFALRDRLDAWLTTVVGALDRDAQFHLDGAASATAWLKDRCGLAGADAARTASTARKLRDLPHTATAWQLGAIGTGHVRAIVANVSARHAEKFAAVEEAMVSAFAALSVTETAGVMQKWAAAADDADPKPDPDPPSDALPVSETLDGRRVLNGHLSSDSAVEVEQALAHAVPDDPDVPTSQRHAAALVALARFFNDHNTKAGSRRNRPHVAVIVNAGANGEPQASTLGGTPLSMAMLGRLLCDAMVSRLLIAKGQVLDYGTEVPSVPIPLWRAVAARDRHCRWPGCDRPVAWCEAHHVDAVEDGGPTVITNLVLLCSHHHHTLHDKRRGFTARLEPDGTLHVTTPDGTTRTTYPPDLHTTLWPPG